MTKDQAIATLAALVSIEVRITNEVQSKRGISKKSLREERCTVAVIFKALTGEAPTAEDISAIVE